LCIVSCDIDHFIKDQLLSFIHLKINWNFIAQVCRFYAEWPGLGLKDVRAVIDRMA